MTLTLSTVATRAVEAAVFAVLLWGFTGQPPVVVGGVAVAVFSIGVTGDAAEAYVGDYAGNVLLGLLVASAAVGATALEKTTLPVAVVGGLVGGWLIFDGVQHLRHGLTRRRRTKNPLSAASDTKRTAAVYRALDDDPRTKTELEADLDLSADELDAALDFLERSGRIREENGTYYADEEFSQAASMLRSPRELVDRIAKPFRL